MKPTDYLKVLGVGAGVVLGVNSAKADGVNAQIKPSYTDSSQLPDTSGNSNTLKAIAEYLMLTEKVPRDFIQYDLDSSANERYTSLRERGRLEDAIYHANVSAKRDTGFNVKFGLNPKYKEQYNVQELFAKDLLKTGYSVEDFNRMSWETKIGFISFSMLVNLSIN